MSLSTHTPSDAGAPATNGKRPYLSFKWSDFLTPLLFMLTLSLTGLRFPLGYLLIPVFLLRAWRTDRYDFLIMLTLAIGGFGMTYINDTFHFRLSYIVVPLAAIFLTVIKKPAIIKKLIVMLIIYAISLFVFAYLSEEVMTIQLRKLMNYLLIAYFVYPIVIFSGREFSMEHFFVKLMPYILIISAFYIIDAAIFSGMVLLPTAYTGAEGVSSTFYNLFWHPLSFHIARKWPVGMLLVSLIIVPSVKMFRLRWWMWLMILLALGFTRTFTVIAGMLICYFLFQGTRKQILKGCIGLAIAFPVLYFIDAQLPMKENMDSDLEQVNSTLRIKSSVDQIFALQDISNEDDLALFMTGRVGQVIPRFEYMYEKNRELIGVGFLDNNDSRNPRFLIYDEYLVNKYDRWRVCTRIEIAPLEVMLTIGYIGFGILTAFYILLCVLVRKFRYREYFYSIIFLYAWYGISDFGGFNQPESLMVIALSFGTVILANRHRIKGFSLYRPQAADDSADAETPTSETSRKEALQ